MKSELPKTISLFNRDNLRCELIYISDRTYKLSMDDLSYMRISPAEEQSDNDYQYFYFIDPPGGPMIHIDMKINDNLTVKEIKQHRPVGPYYNPILILV